MLTQKPRRAPKDAPKPKSPPRAPPTPSQPRVPRLHPAVDKKYLAALTHPFSPAAQGARVPDIGRKMGNGFSAKFRGALTTDGGGAARFVFTANPNCFAFPVSSTATLDGDVRTINTLGGAGFTGLALAQADIAKIGNFRIVSCGLRLTSYVGDNANSGRVSIGPFNTMGRLPFRNWLVTNGTGGSNGAVTEEAVDVNWSTEDLICQLFGVNPVDVASLDYTEMSPHQVSVDKLRDSELVGVIRPTLVPTGPWINGNGGTANSRYQDQTPMGLNCLLVTVESASANTKVLGYEFIVHYEAIEFPLRGISITSSGTNTNSAGLDYHHPQAVIHGNAVASTQPHTFQAGEAVGAITTAAATALTPYARAAASTAWSRLSSLALGFLPELEAALPLLLL